APGVGLRRRQLRIGLLRHDVLPHPRVFGPVGGRRRGAAGGQRQENAKYASGHGQALLNAAPRARTNAGRGVRQTRPTLFKASPAPATKKWSAPPRGRTSAWRAGGSSAQSPSGSRRLTPPDTACPLGRA